MPTRHNKLKGFTLIEMTVVIIIVGVIAGIAIPAMRTSVQDARDKKIRTALNQVDAAKIHYFMDTKDAGEPPLQTLATYLHTENAQNGGEEIFYTKDGWTSTGHALLTTTAGLIDGIPGSFKIKPNAKDTPATWVAASFDP